MGDALLCRSILGRLLTMGALWWLAASTTEPGQRMARSYSELQTWKRQLVKADSQLRNFEASTQREMDPTACGLASEHPCTPHSVLHPD